MDALDRSDGINAALLEIRNNLISARKTIREREKGAK